MPNFYYTVGVVWEPDRSFQNILKNGSFEHWTGEEPRVFAGWTREGDGVLIRDSTTVKVGAWSAKLQNNPASALLLCHSVPPASFGYNEGRVVTFGCHVNTNVSSRARIQIDDGVGSSYSDYHSGSGEWELLTVTRTIASGATKLEFRVGIITGSSVVAYFDGAVAVEGKFLPAFLTHAKDRSGGVLYENPEAFANNVINKTDTAYLLSLSNQGDIDWTDLDVNTAGSGYVPAKANGIFLIALAMDTGASGSIVELRKKGDYTICQTTIIRCQVANQWVEVSLMVGIDLTGCLQYKINASGANTANIYLKLLGWVEPA